MKKNIIILMLSTAIFGTASAQQLTLKTYMEKTHIGIKTGTSVGMTNQFGWEYGGFFQEASLMESLTMSDEQLRNLPRTYERNFYGLYLGIPVMERSLMNIKVQLRTGVQNGENFVITPSLLGNFTPHKSIGFGLGVGMRMFKPTLQGSFSITL
ncbi:MAG: hypothetical protein AAGA66_03510 [Bacteroidota bacterium]